MKRKLSLSLLAIILIVSIVSCDGGIVGFMGKMGENILGVDSAEVAKKVTSSITVSADEESKAEKKEENETTTTTTNYSDQNTAENDVKYLISSNTNLSEETKNEAGTIKVSNVKTDGDKTVAEITVTEKTTTVTKDETSDIKFKTTSGEQKTLFTIKATTSTVTSTNTTYTATIGSNDSEITPDLVKGETKETTETKVTGEPKVEILGVSVQIDNDSAAKLLTIESILPPSDLKDIEASLAGNASASVKETLKETVSDETTKKAVEGTATLVSVLLDSFLPQDKNDEDSTDSDKDSDSSSSQPVSIATTIQKNIAAAIDPTNTEKELTNGDVVALKAMTNVITKLPEDVIKAFSNSEGDSSQSGSSGEGQDAGKEGATSPEDPKKEEDSSNIVNKLGEEVVDEVMSTLTLLNEVSETSTVFNGLDLSSLTKMFSK